MVSLKPITHLFAIDEQGLTPAMRQTYGLGRVILVVYPVICLAVMLFLVNTLWFASQFDSSSWNTFWQMFYATLAYLFMPLRFLPASQTAPGVALRGDFQALRRAVVAGDGELAPVVAAASTPLTSDVNGAHALIGRISRQFAASGRVGYWAGALLAPAGVGLSLLGVLYEQTIGPVNLTALPSDAFSRFVLYNALTSYGMAGIIMLVGPIMAIFGLRFIWRTVGFSADLAVKVDAGGIGWRRAPSRWRTTRQPWAAARAFYSLTYKGGNSPSERRVYALDFGVYMLSWEIVAVSNRYASPRTVAREQAIRAASARLAAAITRHSGLPERDVTALATQIAQANGKLIELGRTLAYDLEDAEAIAALDPPDHWRLPATPIDPLLSPLDVSFGASRATVARKAPRPIWNAPKDTQTIHVARALLPYTGPNARNSDIPGLADPVDDKGMQRKVYALIGVGVAITAIIGVVGACAQFHLI